MKTRVIVFICLGGLMMGLYILSTMSDSEKAKENRILPTQTSFSHNKEFENFTASFEIYTNGTKRIFTDEKYHNQSDDVYIQSSDPHIVYVTKEGVLWNDFFDTLPFSLTKKCLVTGTKQTFCTNDTEKLRFFINDIEVPDALDLLINPDDNLRVTYGI